MEALQHTAGPICHTVQRQSGRTCAFLCRDEVKDGPVMTHDVITPLNQFSAQNHITVGQICHFCWVMFPPCLCCRIFNLIPLTWKDIQCSRDYNLFKSDSPQASLSQMDEIAQEFWHWGLCDLLTSDHRFCVCVYACMGVQECIHSTL